MIITKTEWHQVASRFTYDFDSQMIRDLFGSTERFEELMSQQEQEVFNTVEAYGELITDEEADKFYALFELEYQRDDDWWSDNKGCYEITYKIEDAE